ncbi:uncharacterized protein LOC132796282 [Drosophila nasuta]|uniref:uncharacterized protein LOC132796282 n=1 Tax=Drosophila nasuta TaxID=42062 RepID=UPI00295E9731|nr:uncharacterized protein LOC132796282 [Drosophila nasuta]
MKISIACLIASFLVLSFVDFSEAGIGCPLRTVPPTNPAMVAMPAMWSRRKSLSWVLRSTTALRGAIGPTEGTRGPDQSLRLRPEPLVGLRSKRNCGNDNGTRSQLC